MNLYCRIILTLAFVVLAVIVLFPPRESPNRNESLPRGFLFSTYLRMANYTESNQKTSPEGIQFCVVDYDAAQIAISRLCCEILLTMAVAGFLVVPFWSRRPNHLVQTKERDSNGA